jgi:DNA-binding SARP family transcriptional activator/TolB-like protein
LRFTTVRNEPPKLSITTLGQLTVRYDDRPLAIAGKKARALLGYLAVSETHEAKRERLVGLLWSEVHESNARASLRQTLRELRLAFEEAGAGGLKIDNLSVALDPARVRVDLFEVLEAAKGGRVHPRLLEVDHALEHLLDEFESIDPAFRAWLLAKRQALHDHLLQHLEAALGAETRARRGELARAILNLDPTHEGATRALIRMKAEAGDIGGALRIYKALWDLLDEDYDVEPSKETQELIAAIKLGQPVAVAALETPRTVIVAEAVPGARSAPDIRQLETLVRALVGPYGGRLTVREGDSYVLDFPNPRAAVQAALRIGDAARIGEDSAGQVLRMGAHASGGLDEPRASAKEIAGQLATLAKPGELLVSDQVRDVLTDGLDAVIEDTAGGAPASSSLVRAYRLTPPEEYRAQLPSDILPVVAIIPFEPRNAQTRHPLVGEVVAEELISSISATKELAVISRLSTRAFRGRPVGLDEVREHLRASYVLSGTYHVRGATVELLAEFSDARSATVLWREGFKERTNAILSGSSELIGELAAAISASVLTRELDRLRSRPLETLENYSLLMAAINLSHRASLASFRQARGLLDLLVERLPLHPLPLAWLAKWHIFKAYQGWSEDRAADTQHALDYAAQAINADPTCSIALTVDAWAHLQLQKRFDIASQRFELAVELNPNDSTAWLLKGSMHAFKAEGPTAVAAAQRAIRLSPLDPRRSYYDLHAATAYNSAGDFERAIQSATRSLRVDRLHASSLRALAVAQFLSGLTHEAKQTVAALLRVDPTMTVSKYLSSHPAGEFATGKLWAKTLGRAGLPK